MRTQAHLAHFIIADLTDTSSIPQELQAIVPDLEVPIQRMPLEAKRAYAMFVDFKKYGWVLPVYLYKNQAGLIASLNDEVIEPADKKARKLYASIPNLRNHGSKTSLKPADRPKEADSLSAVFPWKHIARCV
jgi:hypothetical protein